MAAEEHILIVDDEPEIGEMVETYLTRQGYRVSTAQNGQVMRRVMDENNIDLVVLDLVMPDEDGLQLTRYLRDTSSVGIIILTGRGDPVDRIVGLEMGADDYLGKPFEMRELLARIRSVLRRTGAAQNESDIQVVRVRFAGWQVSFTSREVTSPEGEAVPLTTAEFSLLTALVNNPNRILDRDRLLDLLGHGAAGPFDRSIDVLVSRLRRKIEPDPKQPSFIKTIRGAGYLFTPTVER